MMKAVFEYRTFPKLFALSLALVVWPAAWYCFYAGKTFGFWLCVLSIPCTAVFVIMMFTTKYVVDDAGIAVVGKLIPTTRFRWEEITSVTCTRIRPFSPLPFFPASISYTLKTNPPPPRKFAPYISISTDNVKNADQLIRAILERVPPSTHIDPQVRRYAL